MAKVFAIHEIELHPGVGPQEFERLVREAKALDMPGVKNYFLKGNRGERDGKYAVLMEFESAERRNQLFPPGGPPSEEANQWYSAEPARRVIEQFAALDSVPGQPVEQGGTVYTDYEVME